jgi:AmpD protein
MESLKFDKSSGLVLGARQVVSSNCDARPDPHDISLLVVHGISLPPGEFGGPWIDDLFCGRLDPAPHPYFAEIHGLKVSAHLLIRRDGELVQYVPLQLRAWHAGASSFCGRDGCNDYSIGIELEGVDDVPYTPSQYAKLTGLSQMLMQAFPAITPARIVGHSDIAPGRKTDPGAAFDWPLFRRLLSEQQ